MKTFKNLKNEFTLCEFVFLSGGDLMDIEKLEMESRKTDDSFTLWNST